MGTGQKGDGGGGAITESRVACSRLTTLKALKRCDYSSVCSLALANGTNRGVDWQGGGGCVTEGEQEVCTVKCVVLGIVMYRFVLIRRPNRRVCM